MFQLAEQIFSGLIVGTLAKLVMPGEEQGGVIVMALIGLGGSAAGTFIGYLLFGPHHAAGWILSIAGAIAIIYLSALAARALIKHLSLRPQRLHNVDASRPRCRKHGRDDRGNEDDASRCDQRQQPGQSHIWKVTADQPRERETYHRARRNADHPNHNSFNDHVRENPARVRAQSQTDSELAGSPANRKGEHTGNADDRDRQSEGGESAEHQRVQPIGC
jgi:uncharacterized membrane protein YeaQ/YmgE (transglycosylase-associated protein family)